MNSILHIDLPPNPNMVNNHNHHGNSVDDHDHSIDATKSPDHNHFADDKLRNLVISNIETYFRANNISFENVEYDNQKDICMNCKCDFVDSDATVKTCFTNTNLAGDIINGGVPLSCSNVVGKSCPACKYCGQPTTTSGGTTPGGSTGYPGGTTGYPGGTTGYPGGTTGYPGGTTVSGVPSGLTTLSPTNYSNNEPSSNFIMDLLKSLNLDDIMTLLVLLLNIDLDRDGSPDVFQLLKGIKDYIFNKQDYNINNDYELMRRLRNYEGRQLSPYGQGKLSQSNHALFTQIVGSGGGGFGDNSSGSSSSSSSGNNGDPGSTFNSDFVPGYAYSNPELWESEKRPPPVCVKDKYSIKSPAMVLGDGIAMSALNIEHSLLPSFTYTEKSAREQEIEAFNEHREYSCKEYCSDNCTNEICHALECDSCK